MQFVERGRYSAEMPGNSIVAWQNCHSSNVPSIEQKLKDAMAGNGPTVFDWLVEIIRDHDPGGTQAHDGIDFELA